MPLDFPSSPTDGQTYTSAGKTYTYNSAKGVWLATVTSPPAADVAAELIPLILALS